jgi:hypothetical protein
MREPDWADRDVHDPGVMLVQLLLWLSTAFAIGIGIGVLRRLIARPFRPGRDRRDGT